MPTTLNAGKLISTTKFLKSENSAKKFAWTFPVGEKEGRLMALNRFSLKSMVAFSPILLNPLQSQLTYVPGNQVRLISLMIFVVRVSIKVRATSPTNPDSKENFTLSALNRTLVLSKGLVITIKASNSAYSG